MLRSARAASLIASIALPLGCFSTPDPLIPRLAAEPTAVTPLPPEPSDDAPCLHDGEEAHALDDGSAPIPCCEGLGRAPVYKSSVIRLDQCFTTGDGRYTCIRCGNGHCGIGENACNCPADCGD